MRQVAAIPSDWKVSGVWYVPDVENPCATCDGAGRVAIGDCTDCGAKGYVRNRDDPDPFRVRLAPFSGDEFQQSMADVRSRALRIEPEANAAAVIADPIAIANDQAAAVCRRRILEVYGYAGRELDELGERTGRVVHPKDGEELVTFILTHAWQTERKVLDDCYDAIRDRSHLSAGLKKNSRPPLGSSAPGTPASNGAAPA